MNVTKANRLGLFAHARVLVLLLLCVTAFESIYAQADPAIPAGSVRIHYYRPDGNYSGWALYTWNASTENASWCGNEVAATGTDAFGVYYDVTVNPAWGNPIGDLGFILNNCAAGQIKDPGPDQHLEITVYNEAWVIHGNANVFTTQPTPQQISNSILGVEQAYWLDRAHVLVPSQNIQTGSTYALTTSLTGGLAVTNTGIMGGTQIPLTVGGSLTPDELLRYPQLASYTVLQIAPTVPLNTLEQALKGELAFSAVGSTGTLQYATGVQTAGVLDDLYYYPGRLGVIFRREDSSHPVSIRLWAPTAQNVALEIFNQADDTTASLEIPMQSQNGVWSATGRLRLGRQVLPLQGAGLGAARRSG